MYQYPSLAHGNAKRGTPILWKHRGRVGNARWRGSEARAFIRWCRGIASSILTNPDIVLADLQKHCSLVIICTLSITHLKCYAKILLENQIRALLTEHANGLLVVFNVKCLLTSQMLYSTKVLSEYRKCPFSRVIQHITPKNVFDFWKRLIPIETKTFFFNCGVLNEDFKITPHV